MKTSQQIRQDFFDFFAARGHKIVPSAPVIPYDDPTLLFTNAGMNQFKDVFLGTGTRDYKRCANTQKCIRVSGKHNDLEEVGHDGYHHTFFEMLGNWSFGDYYKKEAIRWAWELLTEIWKLDKKRLWATVYKDDSESFEIWKSETNIAHSQILKFDEKDNFWEMGETGPCGPCSEIHYDFSSGGCKASDINAGIPEVMEIWNLVFIQYNRDENGVLHELPQKHVDTGMGFERMVRVLQNKKSNYETDVFLPMINELIQITKKEYSGKYVASMNVIADHVRTLAFAIADGAIPSNEGRGYVLRRILRRAARYGRNTEMHKPFIFNLVDVLAKTMGDVFPEIVEKKNFIKEVVKGEEEGFNETLDRGLVYFNDEVDRMKSNNKIVFSGEIAFKLHDTYGFPVDLTQLMARDLGLVVDSKKFEEMMNIQKKRARSSRGEDIRIESLYSHLLTGNLTSLKVKYNPYHDNDGGVVTRLIALKNISEVKEHGKRAIVYIENNPFYAESGGQVSDAGYLIFNDDTKIRVLDSKKEYIIVDNSKGLPDYQGISTDNISLFQTVVAEVDSARRQSIRRNHSATHLVHEALRRVLGQHVRQMGSLVAPDYLRFDFPHFHRLTENEISEIEQIVNDKIKEDINVYAETMPIEAANKIPNVKKLFGEKYGEDVRVVFIDESYSVEFCGGTHVLDTNDVGLFKIVKEESASSGIRRIFARTGQGIIEHINERVKEIEKIASDLPDKYQNNFRRIIADFNKDFSQATYKDIELLKAILRSQESTIISLLDIREQYLEEKKDIEKRLAKDKVKEAGSKLDEMIVNAREAGEIKVVSGEFSVAKADDLKEIADKLREKIQSGVGLIYSIIDDKVSIVAVVSDNLIMEKGLDAGKIAGDFAKLLGGGGGGRQHLATAGGKDSTRLNEAMEKLPGIIERYLNK